jgi:hypothetical protein
MMTIVPLPRIPSIPATGPFLVFHVGQFGADFSGGLGVHPRRRGQTNETRGLGGSATTRTWPPNVAGKIDLVFNKKDSFAAL